MDEASSSLQGISLSGDGLGKRILLTNNRRGEFLK